MQNCPTELLLRRFNSGDLPEEVIEEVADHLERCSRCEQLAASLETSLDPIEALLRGSSDALAETVSRANPGSSSLGCPPAEGEPAVPQQVGPFEILGELGRGGMSVVYKARHGALPRFVALKMLRGGQFADAEQRSRFRSETEVLARLKHPHVVPIYEVGEVDGQPWFTQELLEGGNLGRWLAGRPQPPRCAPRWLETLARAVQHAHDQGVIHRDLKPSNVLLGSAEGPDAGAMKIADFGVAKLLAAQALQTASGTAVGTPEYMAPEQAGETSTPVGRAADVYALGVILYECLTGRLPLRGSTILETLKLVCSVEPPPPRQFVPSIPRDVETICLKCLHKDPARRYASTRELADDLARWQRGEPVRARRVSIRERIIKWARRRPAVAGLLAALVLLAGLALGVFGALYRNAIAEGVRTRQAEQAVADVLAEGRAHLHEGSKKHHLGKLQTAQNLAERAMSLARTGRLRQQLQARAEEFQGEVTWSLARWNNNQKLLDALVGVWATQETRTYRADQSGQMVAMARKPAEEQYADAFWNWGKLNIDRMDEKEVVARLQSEPEPVVREVVAALDAWMMHRRQKRPQGRWLRLFRVSQQLDTDGRRRQLRELLVEVRPECVASQVAAPSWGSLWGLSHGRTLWRLQALPEGIIPEKDPVLTVVLFAQLSSALGDATAAERLLRKALAARPSEMLLFDALAKILMQQGPRRRSEVIECFRAMRFGNPRLGFGLGLALLDAGKADEAEDVFRDLIRRQPNIPNIHFWLGFALRAQKKQPQAEAAYREAIRLKPDLAEAHSNMGLALHEQKKLPQAEAAYREAIRHKPSLLEAHNNLGNVLADQNKLPEAVAAFREAIRLAPDAIGHYNLGFVLRKQKKLPEAALRQAIRQAPAHAQAHYCLGLVLQHQEKWDAAVAAYRAAILVKPEYAEAHCKLGDVLVAQKKLDEAVAAYREAIRLKSDFVEAHNNLGNALVAQNKLPEAEAAYREAIRVNPDHAQAYCNLGYVLQLKGQFKESLAAYRRGHELGWGKAGWSYRSDLWVHRAEYLVELEKKLPAILAGEATSTSAAEQLDLARVCQVKQLWAVAARFYRDAFAADARLGENVPSNVRYLAACCAARIGCGKGKEADNLDDKERAGWRRQALDWLRGDLRWWGNALRQGDPPTRAAIQQRMQQWQQDARLAGVRDKEALAKLPQDERKQWQQLWTDVAALRKKASAGH